MELPFLSLEDLIKELSKKGLYSPSVPEAISQAIKSHKNQKRTNGNSYLEEHIYPVTFELLQIPEKEYLTADLIIGALLHDAIEDDPEFTEDICLKGFGENTLNIIKPITKSNIDNSHELSQEEKYNINAKYLKGLEFAPYESKLIKLSDRYNNLSCCFSIINTRKEKVVRYIKETKELFLPFANKYSKFFERKIASALNELAKYNIED